MREIFVFDWTATALLSWATPASYGLSPHGQLLYPVHGARAEPNKLLENFAPGKMKRNPKQKESTYQTGYLEHMDHDFQIYKNLAMPARSL